MEVRLSKEEKHFTNDSNEEHIEMDYELSKTEKK